MKKFLILCLLSQAAFAQISSEKILKEAIQYHDPKGEWQEFISTLKFTETRPSGADRKTTIELDNTRGYMKINRNGEEIYEVTMDDCQVIAGGKEAARGLTLRNYYLYLWGLPMKLKDEGTPIDESVNEAEINGMPCYVLRVPYEKDIWYFYFDKSSGRMLEYRFYKDREETTGELIKLEGEFKIGSMMIPKSRSWYTLPEMKFLGTDILSSVE